MTTRREFLYETAYGAVTASAMLPLVIHGAATAAPSPPELDSDIGSLYPFVQSQAIAGEFPLSFLQEEFRDLAAWKRRPAASCSSSCTTRRPAATRAPEVVERSTAATTSQRRSTSTPRPTSACPPTSWYPSGSLVPAPAIVALHDHGGFYLWGKEKLVERDDEHPVLTEFKRQALRGAGASPASWRAPGYVVVVIDMFYWGERRMLLDDDPADWRERPASVARPSASRPSTAVRRDSEQLVGRTI